MRDSILVLAMLVGGLSALPCMTGVQANSNSIDERLPALGESVYFQEMPEAIIKVPPSYPEIARRSGIGGTVTVQALVGRDGLVKDTRIIRSIPMLDEAAVACVRRWHFKPALDENKPIAVWVSIPVRFDLHDHDSSTSPSLEGAVPTPPAGEPPRGRSRFDRMPEAIQQTPARYPDAARIKGVQGTVLVMAYVDRAGGVRKTRVTRSVPGLDAAAVDAVRQWRFKPATSRGRPVACWIVIPVRFALH